MSMATNLEIHEIVRGVFVRNLKNVTLWLKRGEQYARKKRLQEKVLTQARLAPDMFHLIQQVQYAYFAALDVTTGLTGKSGPKLSYEEKTIGELLKSLRKTTSIGKDSGSPHESTS
jgi:uncharacterized protein